MPRGWVDMSQFSSREREELMAHQASRDWNITPRPYRPKNARSARAAAKPRPFNLDDPVELELFRAALLVRIFDLIT